jgi:hypothetical protein
MEIQLAEDDRETAEYIATAPMANAPIENRSQKLKAARVDRPHSAPHLLALNTLACR